MLGLDDSNDRRQSVSKKTVETLLAIYRSKVNCCPKKENDNKTGCFRSRNLKNRFHKKSFLAGSWIIAPPWLFPELTAGEYYVPTYGTLCTSCGSDNHV